SRAAAADHNHWDQHSSHFAQPREHHKIGNVHVRAKTFERRRSLHRKRHAHAESRQRYHRRGAHTYENHLPKNRRELEKLASKRRNKNPIEQTKIELEIIFQSESRGTSSRG